MIFAQTSQASLGGQNLLSLADTASNLGRAVVILAVLSAIVLRAMLDLGARAYLHRSWLRSWLGSRADGVLAILGQLGPEPGIFALDYRQLCAQISAVLQSQISAGQMTGTLLDAFKAGAPVEESVGTEASKPPEQNRTSDSTGDASAEGTNDLQRLSDHVERRVDSLQAFFAQSTTRFIYDTASAISLLLIPLLLAVSTLESNGPISGPASVVVPNQALFLFPFLVVYAALVLFDVKIGLERIGTWLRAMIPGWLIVMILVLEVTQRVPSIRFFAVASVLAFIAIAASPVRALRLVAPAALLILATFGPFLASDAQVATTAIFALGAIVAGILSPIFMNLLGRLYAVR